MSSHRVPRASEDIKRELSDIFRSLKDPRISGMLSIVRIDLSSDYSYCKVYISAVEGLEAAESAVVGLTAASGYIRRELGSRLTLRKTPELKFYADGGIEYSAELDKKLRDLLKQENVDAD